MDPRRGRIAAAAVPPVQAVAHRARHRALEAGAVRRGDLRYARALGEPPGTLAARTRHARGRRPALGHRDPVARRGAVGVPRELEGAALAVRAGGRAAAGARARPGRARARERLPAAAARHGLPAAPGAPRGRGMEAWLDAGGDARRARAHGVSRKGCAVPDERRARRERAFRLRGARGLGDSWEDRMTVENLKAENLNPFAIAQHYFEQAADRLK